MTPGQPSSRLDAQAAEQRWAHVLELCAGEPIEFIRYDAHGPRVLIGDVHTVRRPRISEDASVPPDTEENGTSKLLLIDLLDVDAGAPTRLHCARAERGERQHRRLPVGGGHVRVRCER
jgi:hypothetical protein